MCNSSEPSSADSARVQQTSAATANSHEISTSAADGNMSTTDAGSTAAAGQTSTHAPFNVMDPTLDSKAVHQRTPAAGRQASQQQQGSDASIGTGNNVVVPPKKSVLHSNIFRIGDFCYFETNTKAPYSIRKIEEITKVKDVPEPYVEVKATIFKRRCEIPEQSLQLAQEQGVEDLGPEDTDLSGPAIGDGEDGQAHDDQENEAESTPSTTGRTTRLRARQTRRFGRIELLQQRQLFNTRVTESLPAMYIRGKCYVDTLLGGDIDRSERYFEYSDTFFYSNCYDPDDHEVYKRKRGDIRIGAAFQAEVPASAPSSAHSPLDGGSGNEMTDTITDGAASETTREPDSDNTTSTQRTPGGGYGLRQRGQKRALLDVAGSVKRSGTENMKEEDDAAKQNTDTMDVAEDQATIKADDAADSVVDSRITSTTYDTLLWSPSLLPAQLDAARIKSFVTATKAIGLYSRALELTGGISMRQPSVHITTALANRDMTTQYAYTVLHMANYNIGDALCALNSDENGLLVCRDQFEAWSSSEACLFEEGLARHGKNFGAVRKDFLPWKRVAHIVDYYYAWKTTDRYQQARRFKTSRAVQHMRQFSMHKVAVEDSKQPHRQQITAQTLMQLGSSSSSGPGGITASGGSGNAVADGGSLKCFVCDKALTDYFYHFGPALASTSSSSSSSSAVGGGSGAAGAAASAAAALMYASSTAAQMTRICYDCQLYWRRYACLRRPFINDQERRIVNDFVNLPHERSVQVAASQALSNYQQNVNVSQNTAVQMTAQKLLAQQQQQQQLVGGGSGNDTVSTSTATPSGGMNAIGTSAILTRNSSATQQQPQLPSLGTAAASLMNAPVGGALPGSAFGLGGQNQPVVPPQQPPPFMHGKPPMVVGGGIPGQHGATNSPLRMASSLSAVAAGTNPSNPAALLLAMHAQHQQQQQQQQLQNAPFPSAAQQLVQDNSSASSSSNFNGTANTNLILPDNTMPLAISPPRSGRFGGGNNEQNIVAALRGAANDTAGSVVMPPTSNADNSGPSINETAEATDNGPTTPSNSSSSAAAAQHRNNLRSRVSIFLLMTPASRAMRRLFERRISTTALAKDPCNAALTSSASMPTLADMRSVSADAQTLSRVLTGDGRHNRFRQRKSISDIIRSASVSDLPYPRWLVPSGNNNGGDALMDSAAGGTRLRFPPSDYKLIDPKQVVLEHMNLLSTRQQASNGASSAASSVVPTRSSVNNDTGNLNAAATVSGSGAGVGAFAVNSDMSLTSSVATPSSSPSAAANGGSSSTVRPSSGTTGGGLAGIIASNAKQLGADASCLAPAASTRNAQQSSSSHHHQRIGGGEQHRLAPGTALEDFVWTTSRALTARKYADAAKLVGGVVALHWNGMDAANLDHRVAVKSQLRKAGRNPMRNMNWSKSTFDKK